MNLRAPGRADALAAEYVLGTLPGRTRQRFERMMPDDPVLERAVHRWEERLLPFAEALPPVAPPARIWTAILGRVRASGTARRPSFWESLGWWRGLAIAGLAAVVALAVMLLRPEAPQETLVAVLAGQDAKPALVATADRKGRLLTVKPLAPFTVATDRVLQLWALPQAGNPRSLGLLGTGGITGVMRVPLQASAEQALQVPALAISLEPQGGSPTGLPTGPVLFTGAVQRLY